MMLFNCHPPNSPPYTVELAAHGIAFVGGPATE